MTCRFQAFMPRVSTSMLRPFAVTCLVAVASLGWTGWASAAACSSTNYDLNTQAEVDALGATGCDSVSGYLDIRESTDITNLDGLANITSVGGYLNIYNNAALANLDGLANLTSVGGNLYIESQFAVTNIDGLAKLTSVGGSLLIWSNDALTNLDGLANLTSVGNDLDIYSNDALANLDGLANITSVGGYLSIQSNSDLTNLDGLANLTSVGDYLYIPSNDALTNLDGLANLTSVGGDLYISSNYSASCEGVAPLLGWPNGPPHDTVAGNINIIGNNGSGCNSIEQILASVSGPTKPTITSVSAIGGGSISLEFSSSTTTDVPFPITGYESACIGSSADLNVTASGSGSPITVNDITEGKDYSCTVAPVTGLGAVPASDAVTAKFDFPTAPTVTSTDYEDGTIRLTVSVADNGGADITEYSASCTDGTSTFTGTSSTPTIEVTGLTNGTAYTCSASATNAVGSSGASASTDSITPEPLPTGLPIWLLYEATK